MAENKVEILIAARDAASAVINTTTNATKTYARTLQETNGVASEFSGTIRNMFLAVGGYSVLQNAVSAGYRFNSTMEETRVGLASLIYSMRDFTNASGEAVTGQQAFAAALSLSKEVQTQLRIAGLETAATYEQLTKAYSQAYVPAIKAGFDEKQIVRFTTAVVQAATAMRVPLDMLGEEVRGILGGSMQPRTTMLQPLIEAAGLTNAKIQQLAKEGKLYDAVMKALEGSTVGAAEASKNYSVQLSNLKDAATQALGKGLESGFEKTKAIIKDVTDYIVTFNKETGEIKWNETLVAGLQKLDDKIFSVIDNLRTAGKEIRDFTNNHPIITDLTTGFGGIALKVLAVFAAIKTVGGGLTWLVSHWQASIAYITALLTPLISAIEGIIVSAVTGLSTVATAAAVAAVAVAAIGAAFAGWQIGKQIAQMEILGLTIAEAMQAGYASVAKFFAYCVYAWEMIGATAKAIWNQVKEAGKILFYEFAASIQESFPVMSRFFGLTDNYRQKADAARASQNAIYQDFLKNQQAAESKLTREKALQESIREEIFRGADARNKVRDATNNAGKATENLTASTKKGSEASTEYVLKHRDVNQILDRMSDLLTSGADRIRKLQAEIKKLGGSKIEAEYVDIQERYEEDIAAARKHYQEMVRIERELQEKLAKAREDVGKKNKEGSKEKRYAVDPQVLADVKKAGENVIAAHEQMNTLMELSDKKRAASKEAADHKELLRNAANTEAEIDLRLHALDILEQEGTYHRDTLSERISLTEELLAAQQECFDALDKQRDESAWYAQAKAISDARKKLLEYRNELDPVQAKLRKFAEDASDMGTNLGNAFTSAFSKAEDALAEFLVTGEIGFTDLVNSILKDLARLTIQQTITAPLAKSLSSINWSSLLSGLFGSAHGNVFSSGRIMPFAKGTVVSKPTLFPMANGTGLMGEAGEEAILPLTRLSGGDLGVKATTTQAQPSSVKVEIKNESGQKMAVSKSEASWNGQELIVTAWLDAFQRNAFNLRTALGG